MKNIFSDLIKQRTNFFIFDTKGRGEGYKDIDYVEYHLKRARYNQVKSGDLFL